MRLLVIIFKLCSLDSKFNGFVHSLSPRNPSANLCPQTSEYFITIRSFYSFSRLPLLFGIPSIQFISSFHFNKPDNTATVYSLDDNLWIKTLIDFSCNRISFIAKLISNGHRRINGGFLGNFLMLCYQNVVSMCEIFRKLNAHTVRTLLFIFRWPSDWWWWDDDDGTWDVFTHSTHQSLIKSLRKCSLTCLFEDQKHMALSLHGNLESVLGVS
jgi:hypothetical protein